MRNEFTALVERAGRWYKAAALKSLAGAINLILEDRRKDGLRGVPATARREKVVAG